jgi:two-component system, OmpR family, phosphate regulon sensor histidine kinase PhoR
MNLPSTQDLSVYQLVLDTLESAQSFRVSPDTLKSLVGALLDVLIDGKIPATLWVKLPPSGGWRTELKRYQQQVGAAQKIYLCNSSDKDLIEVADDIDRGDNVQETCRIYPIQLLVGKHLENEYFLLVLSENFSGLLVAYQTHKPEPSNTTEWHKTQPLSAIFTVERRVLQRVLEAIKEVIAVDDSISNEVLEFWETRLSQHSASHEQAILTQLLVKQIQRTEESLHSPTSSDRRCSDSVVSSKSAKLKHPLDAATTTPPSANDGWRDKNEFLKRVIQELRTPLTNMKTAMKLLDAEQLKPVQRKRYMQLLNTECDRQNSLMTSLLELVQLECESPPTVMPSIQLADIVPGVVSTYQPIAREKGIQLGYTIPSGLPAVSCMETWLRQIIINLLNNSLKFTPTGGQVKVQATLQGKYIQLVFEDTGIGIPLNEIPKIFDSFYRGRSTIGENTGAGLGLTIVQQLVLRCSGSISVTSKLGVGSCFKVLLPVALPKTLSRKSGFRAEGRR